MPGTVNIEPPMNTRTDKILGFAGDSHQSGNPTDIVVESGVGRWCIMRPNYLTKPAHRARHKTESITFPGAPRWPSKLPTPATRASHFAANTPVCIFPESCRPAAEAMNTTRAQKQSFCVL